MIARVRLSGFLVLFFRHFAGKIILKIRKGAPMHARSHECGLPDFYMFFRHFFRRVATNEHDRQIEHAETAEDNASKVPHRHDLTDMVEPALPSSLEVQNATPRRVPIGDTEDDDECATTLRSQVEDESEWSFLSHSVDSD